jgi:hypothetical protein
LDGTGCHVLSSPFGRRGNRKTIKTTRGWLDKAETGYHVLSSPFARENKKMSKQLECAIDCW